MALYITNPEADRLARELAEKTGESLTDAVLVALRERLERTAAPTGDERLSRALAIARRAAARIGNRPLAPDDLYDADGLPARSAIAFLTR